MFALDPPGRQKELESVNRWARALTLPCRRVHLNGGGGAEFCERSVAVRSHQVANTLPEGDGGSGAFQAQTQHGVGSNFVAREESFFFFFFFFFELKFTQSCTRIHCAQYKYTVQIQS